MLLCGLRDRSHDAIPEIAFAFEVIGTGVVKNARLQ
jgi:hypothetical protein